MKKLNENSVWSYIDEDRTGSEIKYHHFICNYGSKANFLKLIQSVHWISVSWTRERITESGNVLHLKLSTLYPESFIHYTTKGQWDNDMNQIELQHLIEKNPK